MAGPVNRALLQSFFQNPGDIYLDTKTEGALNTLADAIDSNSVIFNADGSSQVPSLPIAGVTGTNVYDQLVSIETQVQAIVGGSVAPGTITTSMIQDNAVTFAKLSQGQQAASVGGICYAYNNFFGF